jgi:hypothetical protein
MPDFRHLTFLSSLDARLVTRGKSDRPRLSRPAHCRPNVTCSADRHTPPQARSEQS